MSINSPFFQVPHEEDVEAHVQNDMGERDEKL